MVFRLCWRHHIFTRVHSLSLTAHLERLVFPHCQMPPSTYFPRLAVTDVENCIRNRKVNTSKIYRYTYKALYPSDATQASFILQNNFHSSVKSAWNYFSAISFPSIFSYKNVQFSHDKKGCIKFSACGLSGWSGDRKLTRMLATGGGRGCKAGKSQRLSVPQCFGLIFYLFFVFVLLFLLEWKFLLISVAVGSLSTEYLFTQPNDDEVKQKINWKTLPTCHRKGVIAFKFIYTGHVCSLGYTHRPP